MGTRQALMVLLITGVAVKCVTEGKVLLMKGLKQRKFLWMKGVPMSTVLPCLQSKRANVEESFTHQNVL